MFVDTIIEAIHDDVCSIDVSVAAYPVVRFHMYDLDTCPMVIWEVGVVLVKCVAHSAIVWECFASDHHGSVYDEITKEVFCLYFLYDTIYLIGCEGAVPVPGTSSAMGLGGFEIGGKFHAFVLRWVLVGHNGVLGESDFIFGSCFVDIRVFPICIRFSVVLWVRVDAPGVEFRM